MIIKKSLGTCICSCFLIIVISLPIVTHSQSPKFPRQVVLDPRNDYQDSDFYGITINKNLNCNMSNSFFPDRPDIEEVNYISDGNILNLIVWFSNPFNYGAFGITNNTNYNNETTRVAINIEKLNETKSLESYTRDRLFSINKLTSFKKVDESNSVLFNLSAHKVVYDYSKNGIPLRAIKIWALENDTEYVFTYVSDISAFERFLPMVDHIQNSFINSSFKNNSHMLKGYSIYDDGNISFQYPEGWNLTPKNNASFISITPENINELFFKDDRKIILSFDINSGYDVRGEDYRVYYDWDPLIQQWKRSAVEMKSSHEGTRHLVEKIIDNQTTVDILPNGNIYADLYVNLSKFNFPDKYSVIPFVYDYYANGKGDCNIDFYDFGEEVYFPPVDDDFKFTFSPDNIVVRQGESTDIELQVKNNNLKINSTIALSSTSAYSKNLSSIDYIRSTFTPEKIYTTPDGVATSVLNIRISDNAPVRSHTIATDANVTISGPLRRMINGLEIPTPGINVTKNIPITITVMPKITYLDMLSGFAKDMFSPLVGGVASLIAILTGGSVGLVELYKKRKNRKSGIKT